MKIVRIGVCICLFGFMQYIRTSEEDNEAKINLLEKYLMQDTVEALRDFYQSADEFEMDLDTYHHFENHPKITISSKKCNKVEGMVQRFYQIKEMIDQQIDKMLISKDRSFERSINNFIRKKTKVIDAIDKIVVDITEDELEPQLESSNAHLEDDDSAS